jgi:hypothetical protein
MPAIQIADLNNAKTDVDHIADIANSEELTATDRLGRTKPTLEGLRQAYPNAEPAAAAAAASAGDASASAALAQDWATKTSSEVVVGQGYGSKKYSNDAATQAAVATTQAGLATTAKTAAEAARDAAFAASRIYASAAAGDTATTSGQYYWVVSSTPGEAMQLWLHNGTGGSDTGVRTPHARLGSVLDDLPGPILGTDTLMQAMGRLQEQINQITGAGMPAGALGIWYADQFSTARRAVVPNAVSTAPTSYNLLAAPRGMFTDIYYWHKIGSPTVADNVATSSDGTLRASTLVMAAGQGLNPFTALPLAAGTYTLVAEVKRKSDQSTDQNFTLGIKGVNSSVKVATSSWQRFAYTQTITASSNVDVRIATDGTNAANLEIGELSLYPGSVDLGPEVYAGHLYPGFNAFDPNINYASGALNLDGNLKTALLQFTQGQTLTAFTVVCVAARNGGNTGTGAGTSSTIISDAHNFNALTAQHLEGGKPQTEFGGTTAAVYLEGAGMWEVNSGGFHATAHRYDGTNFDLWNDNAKMLSKAASSLSATISGDFYAGMYFAPGYDNPFHRLAAMALYPFALTDAQVRQAVSALKARVAKSQTVVMQNVYVAEGDSISDTNFSNTTTHYPGIFVANSSPKMVGACYAVSGSSISNLNARAASVDAIIPAVTGGRKFILSVLCGTNDLTGTDAASFLTSLAAYCDARRAAGWKVVVGTILPRSDAGAATFNSRRATVNAAITSSWVGVHCNAVADFAADATMGPDAAAANTTYYLDGVHPTNAGQTILESIIRPVINGLQ